MLNKELGDAMHEEVQHQRIKRRDFRPSALRDLAVDEDGANAKDQKCYLTHRQKLEAVKKSAVKRAQKALQIGVEDIAALIYQRYIQ